MDIAQRQLCPFAAVRSSSLLFSMSPRCHTLSALMNVSGRFPVSVPMPLIPLIVAGRRSFRQSWRHETRDLRRQSSVSTVSIMAVVLGFLAPFSFSSNLHHGRRLENLSLFSSSKLLLTMPLRAHGRCLPRS